MSIYRFVSTRTILDSLFTEGMGKGCSTNIITGRATHQGNSLTSFVTKSFLTTGMKLCCLSSHSSQQSRSYVQTLHGNMSVSVVKISG